MGTKERRERERSETRDKILDAARELFTSQGYDRVSMRQIADKIEYTPTTIYGYFPDKETLFLELCHTDFHRLAESVSQLAVVADPVERLKLLGRSYIEFGINNPNHYRMMFMTAHPEVNEQYTDLLGSGESRGGLLRFPQEFGRRGMPSGSFSRGTHRSGTYLADPVGRGTWSRLAADRERLRRLGALDAAR